VTGIAAIVLAAGSSQRFGDENKLLAPVDGKPLLSHVLDRIAGLPLAEKIVVVRPGDEAVMSLVREHAASIVENDSAADGMGTSIAAGVKHAGNVEGVMVILGDMPLIRQSTCRELLAALREHPDKTIVVPTCEQRRGHPVLFRRTHFSDLMALNDDTGAKHILAANAATLLSVPTTDTGVLADIDVPG
jgi:molybdenum cofactor cytidylyltransferase